MTRRPLAALAALAALSFAACQRRHSESASPGGSEPRAAAAPSTAAAEGLASPAGLDAPAPADSRKIMRTGQLSLTVDTYDTARERIEAVVAEAGGFVDSTKVTHLEGQVSRASIVIRVPAAGFGRILPQLRQLGRVESESTDAADITDQYVDVAARLDSVRALEKRLLQLAATRTGKVAEVLEVERELARVRGEVEQYEGRIRLWDNQVSLSTLTIELSTRQPEIARPGEPGFGDRASSAFDQSIAAVEDAGTGLVIFVIALAPWLPLLVPGFLFGRRWLRRRAAMPRAVAVMAPPAAPAPPPAAPPA